MKKDVVIVDANLNTPNVGLQLGAPIVPVTLNHVLKGKAEIEEAIYEHSSGTKIVPSSLSVKELTKFNTKKLPDVAKKLSGLCDYVIFDSAAGFGEEVMAVLEAAEEIIIVTNPEMPAVTDAFKIVTLAKEIGIPVKGVVLNKVRKDNFDLGFRAIEGLLETPITSVIEDDKTMRMALYRKKPIIHIKPKSRTAQQYHHLAKRVHSGKYQRRIEELERENSFLKSLLKTFGLN